MSIYTENGYVSRADYLKCMSEDYGVPYAEVLTVAALYGPEEDFDGLLCALEEMSEL